MKSFGKILRKISRKHSEEGKHPVLGNSLILEIIFNCLPLSDIKTAALVCRLFSNESIIYILILCVFVDFVDFFFFFNTFFTRTWRSVLELARFWQNCQMILRHEDFQRKLNCERIRSLHCVSLSRHLTEGRIHSIYVE